MAAPPIASAAAFQTAIDGHNRDLGLQTGHCPGVDLWHMIASAIEWCEAQNPRVDFDLTLENVREHFAGG